MLFFSKNKNNRNRFVSLIFFTEFVLTGLKFAFYAIFFSKNKNNHNRFRFVSFKKFDQLQYSRSRFKKTWARGNQMKSNQKDWISDPSCFSFWNPWWIPEESEAICFFHKKEKLKIKGIDGILKLLQSMWLLWWWKIPRNAFL